MFGRNKLKYRGIGQSRLADILDVSPKAVSGWERGEILPDISTNTEFWIFYQSSTIPGLQLQYPVWANERKR